MSRVTLREAVSAGESYTRSEEKGEDHLHRIQEEAQAVIARALGARK